MFLFNQRVNSTMKDFHMNDLPCLDHVGHSTPVEHFPPVALLLEYLARYPQSYLDQLQIDLVTGSQADSG